MTAMPREVHVVAPSRLHFGLYALSKPPESAARSFGGVGVMVQRPGLSIRFRQAKELSIQGRLADRVARFANRWAEFYGQPLANLAIDVAAAPPDHIGLGTGTQLGLAISAGLTALRGLPVPGPEELARSVGRGLRSAVGTYGFSLGGLIAERGKLPNEVISPLDARLTLPDAWRFVLARPLHGSGLAGATEQRAMDSLQRDFSQLSEQLITEARDALIPGAALGNFAQFAESLGRYCELAGKFYEDVQRGPYNGPEVTALAAQIRALGYRGFGQSSWGPTLFVACEGETSAEELASELRRRNGDSIQVDVTAVCNEGATVTVFE